MITPEERESLMRAMEIKHVLVDCDGLPLHRCLKIKRVHDNFTQIELAAILGMGASSLSEVEKGKRRVPYKYRQRVENYLYHEMYHDKQFVGEIEQ
ncbi:helix-turn-helix domain-containing protein [Metabacillus idriensis]|uniref:helix-turn-helix domain-containing protein n=1 Tax=Metabacillus idriensis TaxID=324768 RepID=UPI00174E4A16|nr:helix-turn-helix transcriptional regulator [Metabacillus idriensis]